MSQTHGGSYSLCFLAQGRGLGPCKSYMDYNKICHIQNRLRQFFFGEIHKERSCLLAVEFATDTIFPEAVLCQQRDCPKGNRGETPRQRTSIRPSITGPLRRRGLETELRHDRRGGRNPTDNGKQSSCHIMSAQSSGFLPASTFSLQIQMCNPLFWALIISRS